MRISVHSKPLFFVCFRREANNEFYDGEHDNDKTFPPVVNNTVTTTDGDNRLLSSSVEKKTTTATDAAETTEVSVKVS